MKVCEEATAAWDALAKERFFFFFITLKPRVE